MGAAHFNFYTKYHNNYFLKEQLLRMNEMNIVNKMIVAGNNIIYNWPV